MPFAPYRLTPYTSLITAFFSMLLLFLISCKDNAKPKAAAAQETTTQEVKESTNDSATAQKTILFYGNSLTAGYGLNEEESFPSLIQKRLDSLGMDYQVINAGLSGETTAGGLGRLDWVLQQQVDIFVLELGANDMLRGLDVDQTRQNLEKIIEGVRSTYPDVKIILAGMQAPPNMGPTYTQAFNNIYPEIAQEKNVRLIPFLLEGVAGNPSLNLPDGKHPNAKGQTIVRDNVWEVLRKTL